MNSEHKKNEKGIAILFTLGLLSLLLVLAIAFSSTAITQRKAATNNANRAQARILAESTLQKILARMEYFPSDNAILYSHCDSDSHPAPFPTQNLGNTDWIYKLSMYNYLGTNVFEWWNTGANSLFGEDGINWEYVFQDIDNDTKPEIIGRTAFVVFQTNGIDPAALVKSGKDESDNDEARYGAEVNEINIYSLYDYQNKLHDGSLIDPYPNNGNPQPYAPPWDTWVTGGAGDIQKFGWTNANGTFQGPAPDSWEHWPNFVKMFDASHLNIQNPPLANEAQKYAKQMKLKEWFFEYPKKDHEAYWIDHNDIDGDGTISSSGGKAGLVDLPYELYHRFNIGNRASNLPPSPLTQLPTYVGGATSWNNLDGAGAGNNDDDVKAIMGDFSLAVNTAARYPIQWSSSPVANDGLVIRWLANWKEKATFADGATRGKQIAANLIDYCDSEDPPVVTTDNPADPTYTGNEKTPYLNEIAIEVDCATNVMDGGTDVKHQYTISMFLGVERIDLAGYGSLAQNADVAVVEGTLQYTWVEPDGTEHPESQNLAALPAVAVGPPAGGGYNFQLGAAFSITVPTVPNAYSSPAAVPAELKDLKVSINKVSMSYDGNFADFAKPDAAGEWSDVLPSLAQQSGNGTKTEKAFFSYQVEDPRQNLNNGDWEQATATVEANYGNTGRGTPNSKNKKRDGTLLDPSTSGKDPETATDPVDVSTAFIRNAPMQSPWELGAIHRGAKWETLNLKEYNLEEATTGGGNAYSDGTAAHNGGDANILDQIKMTSLVESPMKVSFNVTYPNDIFYALIKNINLGCGYVDPAAGGAPINPDNIDDVMRPIIPERLNFFTRANVANISSLYDGLKTGVTMDTDKQKEELIGKFINLTSASKSDYFTIIILAQGIKDIGANSPATITIRKDLDLDGDTTGNVTESNCDIDGKNSDYSGVAGSKYLNFNEFMNDTLPGNPEVISCQQGRYDQYGDEILSEQKIKVDILRDSSDNNKCKILRFEYIND